MIDQIPKHQRNRLKNLNKQKLTKNRREKSMRKIYATKNSAGTFFKTQRSLKTNALKIDHFYSEKKTNFFNLNETFFS